MSNVQLVDFMGGDLRTVNAARVSYNKEHKEFDEVADRRLIEYLLANGHHSPFYHTQITFKFKMPLFVARQWFRHHVGFARSEVYVDSDISFFGFKHLRRSDPRKKQGSSIDEEECLQIFADHYRESLSKYRQLLDMGVCREQARAILPQAMMTEFYETGSLWAYLNLIRESAQLEIKEYALQVLEILRTICPVTLEGYEN